MTKKIKHSIKKAKTELKKIPVAIVTLTLGAFFLSFLAIFVRKKNGKNKK